MTDNKQPPAHEQAFVDTPLLHAKRIAFDQPTQENLDKLIAAAQAAIPTASAAWQDVECYLTESMGGGWAYTYNAKEVERARAADAQQIAALLDEIHQWRKTVSYAVGDMADTETPESCRAAMMQNAAQDGRELDTLHTQIAALRAENEQLQQQLDEWVKAYGQQAALREEPHND